MKSYSTYGIIIKKRNFLEKDRILTIFSRDRGKIEILSKGCRRPGSKLSYCSDLGVIGRFFLHAGKSLDTLTDFQPIFYPQEIIGDYEKTNFMGAIFSIVNKLFELDQPHRKTYALLCEIVENLNETSVKLNGVVFWAKLSEDLGIRPNLNTCLVCKDSINSRDDLCFNEEGEIFHRHCRDLSRKISTDTVKFIKLLLDKDLFFIRRIKASTNVLTEAEDYFETYFVWHFGKIINEATLRHFRLI